MNYQFTYKYDVFISYDEKDVTWVQDNLIPKLGCNKITYIEPLNFELGVPKASLIETAIKNSRKILLIITNSYLRNYWNQFDGFLSISYGLNIGEWRTIPIIVENCELPERLSALSYLKLYQGDFAAQWERLIKNLKSQQGALLLDEDGTVILSENEFLPPRHSFDSNWLNELEAPEGTVKLRSKFYVQRENEPTWLDKVLRWGETIRVKGAHQMGKSSLLARMHQRAKENGRAAFYLDFQSFDEAVFSSLDSLLRYVAERLARRWRTSYSPDTYWCSPLGAKDKLTDFVLAELLEKANLPILLILDDVDRVFNYDYRDDFFSLIRAWHNERALEEGDWQKLNIILSYSTEAFLFIQDLDQSPFNVGFSIELTDFSCSKVVDMNLQHNRLIEPDSDLDSLIQLLGGHPYLLRMAFYSMAMRKINLSQLCRTACNDDGPFSEHLFRYLRKLENWLDLRNAMREVLESQKCTNNEIFYRLRASGLVSGHSPDSAKARCELYAQYFGTRL
jgi:hypothetical protein